MKVYLGVLVAAAALICSGCSKKESSSSEDKPSEEKTVEATKSGVSGDLADQIEELIDMSEDNFDTVRIDASKKDSGGDDNYEVKGGFNACGPKSEYNKVWHWRSMKGNWEYVCDVNFDNHQDATAYYDDMKEILTGVKEFEWVAEKKVNDQTRRRLEGYMDDPPHKIMFDYDVSADGSVEIEFWFKQKRNPGGSAAAAPSTDKPAPAKSGGSGDGGISPNLKSEVAQLLGYSMKNFEAIRDDSSASDLGGDASYRIKGDFNACGEKSEYNKVWHWKTMKGNWEYVCDVDFSNEKDATAYYDAMKAVLLTVPGYTWAPEKAAGSTARRVEGLMKSPPRKIMFDYDRGQDGAVEIEFWYKQKDNPGPVKAGAAPPSGGDTSISPILASQVKQLIAFAKSDFSAIRIDSTESDMGGDKSYRVKGFNACGEKSEYNKVWHWKTMRGNWEYVCDVDFSNTADATAYYDAMKAVLTGIGSFKWSPERPGSGSTKRRLEGFSSDPKLKIMFDFDQSGDGSVEIEFWFKQKFK